jgi:hypothetical protein
MRCGRPGLHMLVLGRIAHRATADVEDIAGWLGMPVVLAEAVCADLEAAGLLTTTRATDAALSRRMLRPARLPPDGPGRGERLEGGHSRAVAGRTGCRSPEGVGVGLR